MAPATGVEFGSLDPAKGSRSQSGVKLMSAYALRGVGARPDFTSVPRPTAGPGEVLVKVTATSINPHDASVRDGSAARYMAYDYPVVLGSDIAGSVESVGDGVGDLARGDRVFGLVRERVARRGSLAPFAAIPRQWLTLTPAEITDVEAGALGLAALTAVRCIDGIEPLEAAQIVFVNGAAGGVGTYLLQLLRDRGIHVIATARPGVEDAHARAAGAAETIDWTTQPVADAIRDHHPEGIDAIVDLVTSDPAALTALTASVLRVGGRVASTKHAFTSEDHSQIVGGNLQIDVDADTLERIARLAETGVLTAAITAEYDIDDVEAAFAHAGAGTHGKISVRIPTGFDAV